MESDSHPPPRPEATWRERWGLHGDLPVRVFSWAARHCPWFIEPILLFGYTLFIFVFGSGPRKAVRENLRVLFPNAGWLALHLKSYRVFREFAEAMKDGMFARAGRDLLTWEIAGRDEITRLKEETGCGGIILTAHMGNYDIAAPLFARHFPRPVHIVRAPERQAQFQNMQREHFDNVRNERFQILYNDSDDQFLGVELARILSRGEFVAIQGDRVVFDVASVNAPYPESEKQLRIPNGPFVLASISGAPILPLFVVRTGHRRYRVVVHPPILLNPDRSTREQSMKSAADDWINVLSSIIGQYWEQWFVFEEAFIDQDRVMKPAHTSSTPDRHQTDVETIRTSKTRPAPWRLSLFMAGATTLLLAAFWVYVALAMGLTDFLWWSLVALALPFAVFDSVHLLLTAAAGLTWFTNKLTGMRSNGNWTELWTLVLGSCVALWLLIAAPMALKLTVLPWFGGLVARLTHITLPSR